VRAGAAPAERRRIALRRPDEKRKKKQAVNRPVWNYGGKTGFPAEDGSMTETAASPILRALRRLSDEQRLAGLSDQALLQRFLDRRDPAAVQVIIRRHGPMVLDVCRAVVPSDADAEDAFQATFVVLIHQARGVRKAASLASWLHGVAYRTALKARADFARRRKHESRVPPRPAAQPEDPASREARQLLHEELGRLAERHRTALVLCYLQGKTQDEAAELLGVAKGTLKGRLERARVLLRRRLVRRGLAPTAALIVAVAPAATASAAVPPALTSAASASAAGGGTLSAPVARLSAAVGRALLLIKLRAVAAVGAALLLLCVGGGLLVGQDGTPVHPENSPALPKNPAPVLGAGSQDTSAVTRFAAQLRRSPVRRLPNADGLGLFLMDLQSSATTLIAAEVDHERAYCGSPCWSNDGQRILFDASPGQQWDKTRLQMLQATDTGPGLSSFGVGNCPTVSPDGKQIAYLVNAGAVPGARPGIYVMNADGTNRRWLGDGGKPRWSPDGRDVLSISFTNPCRLSLIDVATARERPVRLPGHDIYSVPSWAAANTLVAVVRSGKEFCVAVVDVSNADQAAVKETLWRRGDGTNVEPLYPVYSPTTRQGVFVGREAKGQALYAFRPGAAPRRVEADRYDGKIASLALSPDGRYLLFCSDRP
jgi:RNA polymerase sigma factor (sigma-70 family)